MTVTAIKKVSGDCIKITDSTGTSFFIRTVYLCVVDSERIDCDAVFNDAETADIIDAGFAFVAEQQALSYLGRSEHSRFILEAKLAKKSHEKASVHLALDYLEQRKILDDSRFAQAWLCNRLITRAEGPSRLVAELTKRGIDRKTADDAISEFFKTVSLDETFERSVQKLKRLGKSGDKLKQSLLRLGFTHKQFKKKDF